MSNALVTIYGDSITKGVRMEDGRYSIHTGGIAALAAQFSLLIRNRSKFGCTIDRGLARIRRDLAGAHDTGTLTVLEYGGNDSDFDWAAVAADPDGTFQPNTPPETFRRLYREAIDLVRSGGSEPVVMTLPPISSGRYLDWICRDGLDRASILHWLGDAGAIARWQAMYSRAVTDIARACGAALIDVRSAFLACSRVDALLCDDGIHPNARGQQVILDTCADFIAARRCHG